MRQSMISDQMVVASKLAPPRYGRDLVPRANLVTALDDARGRALHLLIAPAGFGKTTLLTQWRRRLLERGCAVAWLTLEQSDDEETRFVACLVAAMRLAGVALGSAALDVVNRGRQPETVASILVNEVHEYARELYLVLDDYHHVHAAGITRLLDHLLARVPANLHIVLASRTTPTLHLSALRLRDLTHELDFRDLRFDLEETRTFLSARWDHPLALEAVHALHRSTDGWVVGLQLAAIASRGHHGGATDAAAPLAAGLAGFLTENVLDGLPAPSRDFLMKTSISERFTAPLCAALTGRKDAAELLQRAESDNLFVLPVEGADGWYRFHPLFAEFLRERLQARRDADPADLHRRAAAWFRSNGLPTEATRHALEAGDVANAVALVAQSSRQLVEIGHYQTLVQWVRKLPAQAVFQDTHLLTNTAFALAMCMQFAEARSLADAAAGRTLAPADFDPEVVRGLIELFSDDTEGALSHLPEWVAQTPSTDSLQVCAASNVLTCAYAHAGRFDEARGLRRVTGRWRAAERTPAEFVYSKCVTGLTWAIAGDMQRAEPWYRDALALAERTSGHGSHPAGYAAAFLAEVLYEANALEQAEAVLAGRLEVIIDGPIPDSLIRGFVSMARARAARGDHASALAVLERMQARAEELGLARVHAAGLGERIRILLLCRDEDGARALLGKLTALSQTRPDAHGTFATVRHEAVLAKLRMQVALGDGGGALPELQSQIAVGDTRGLALAALRLRVLRAVALEAGGRQSDAVAAMAQAMRLAATRGLVRPLVDEPGAAALARSGAVTDAVAPEFIARVTAAARAAMPVDAAARYGAGTEGIGARERQILALLARGYSNKRIANAMGLSAETVKWYLKRIYPKLGVGDRDSAADQARARGLV
ncbi:MAG: hypothetical protein IT495_11790 [Gammaproteobacteria bacterium]|nr:hypothetical protein [Gammaproteobacteria bacterium]